ncbi:MAG: hypothetical protein WDO19_23165 [Bacteroidota bacterium]
MRNLILFLFITTILFSACKKSGVDKPVEGPSASFAFDYMEVEEYLFGANLYLYGNFGDSTSASKVKIGNTLVDGKASADGVILAWTPFYIKVSIGDPDDDTGAGYVSVINGGKETNKRMLNVWEISLLYKEPDEGSILKEVRFNAILRADANPHRNVISFSIPSSFSSRSEAYWAIGGQGHAAYSGGGMTISLEDRSGMVIWSKPYLDNTNEENNFQSEVLFKDGAFEISDLRMHKKDATRYSYLADGSPAPYTTDYDFRVQVLPLNKILKLELDNNRAIKAGTYTTGPHSTQYDFTWDADEAPNHMHNFTLEWEKVEPRFNL